MLVADDHHGKKHNGDNDMAYRWQGENWAHSLIVDAIKAGFTIEVEADGDRLYKGTQPVKAWEAATACDECHVYLLKDNKIVDCAFIVLEYNQPGDEVINDTSCGGWLESWWHAKFDAQVDA